LKLEWVAAATERRFNDSGGASAVKEPGQKTFKPGHPESRA